LLLTISYLSPMLYIPSQWANILLTSVITYCIDSKQWGLIGRVATGTASSVKCLLTFNVL